MDERLIDDYLDALARELRARGAFDPQTLEEARSHLLEGVEHGLKNGLSDAEAQRQTLKRFGSARMIAARFGEGKDLTMKKVLFVIALVLGLVIAYVDSRPTWDDTGITVLALLATSGVLGLLAPQRPWLWALALGVWIPLWAVVSHHNFGLLPVLIFPFIGAYAGMGVRLLVNKTLHPA